MFERILIESKMTKKGRKFVSAEISKLIKKGPSSGPEKGKKYPWKRAVAAVLSQARRKGYKVSKINESIMDNARMVRKVIGRLTAAPLTAEHFPRTLGNDEKGNIIALKGSRFTGKRMGNLKKGRIATEEKLFERELICKEVEESLVNIDDLVEELRDIRNKLVKG